MARKVLLVDDSDTALLLQRMILLRGRYEVITARNGAEAVELAARARPDVIVMDVMMPEMDGFEACLQIRARGEIREIPIVLVTTRGEPQNVENGYACGCNEYVTKPVDGVELLAKLDHLLADRDAGGERR